MWKGNHLLNNYKKAVTKQVNPQSLSWFRGYKKFQPVLSVTQMVDNHRLLVIYSPGWEFRSLLHSSIQVNVEPDL
jgi:hypothetical protein